MGKLFGVIIGALVLVGAVVAFTLSRESSDHTALTVMSFNVWGAGANESKPIDETVAAIKAADADVIGLQETRVEGPKCTASSCPRLG